MSSYIMNNPMLRVENTKTRRSLVFAVGHDGGLIAHNKLVEGGSTRKDPTAVMGENRLTDVGVKAIQDALDGISSQGE
jgi:hypothetical protein